MTPEQRLDRLERVVKLMIKAGLRARQQSREQNEKINILIHSQMRTSEQIDRFSLKTEEAKAETDKALKTLAAGQAKTDEALRAFINSLRKGPNGKSKLN